ncbi:MAG TPA: class I SAM-dependent methyltransferase [Flavobacteriaceae bacterium]|nr:class I SAM-dependent methyltransferase [Flavobacteriaceae bacterium]
MDVYGKMLEKGETDTEFYVEREDGHISTYSFKEWLGKHPQFNAWEKEIFDHLNKGSILDIGCGTGKHVAYAESLGFTAKGIDTSEDAIKIGQEYERDLECLDFWKLGEEQYDNVIIMDSTVGFIAPPEKLSAFFQKMKTILSTSGRLALTSINWPDATNSVYEKYIQSNKEKNKYPGYVKLRFKTKGFTGDWFEGYYYDIDSLVKVAIENGFYPRWINYNDRVKYTVVFENKEEDPILS